MAAHKDTIVRTVVDVNKKNVESLLNILDQKINSTLINNEISNQGQHEGDKGRQVGQLMQALRKEVERILSKVTDQLAASEE